MKIERNIEFNLGQVVFLKTDKEQNAKIVTGILLQPFNAITYCLNENGIESWHYSFEISESRDIIGYSLN